MEINELFIYGDFFGLWFGYGLSRGGFSYSIYDVYYSIVLDGVFDNPFHNKDIVRKFFKTRVFIYKPCPYYEDYFIPNFYEELLKNLEKNPPHFDVNAPYPYEGFFK